jgi:hypothetical protein
MQGPMITNPEAKSIQESLKTQLASHSVSSPYQGGVRGGLSVDLNLT